MRTVSALFDTYDEVTAAVDGLADIGVPGREISVQTQNESGSAKIVEGAGLGAAIGGIGGVLAGIAATAVPPLGFILGAGLILPVMVATAAGGVAGGIVGSLQNSRVAPTAAHVCTQGSRRGATLVEVRVHDDEAPRAIALLQRCGAIDTDTRREEYAGSDWDFANSRDIWDDDIGLEDARMPKSHDPEERGQRRA